MYRFTWNVSFLKVPSATKDYNFDKNSYISSHLLNSYYVILLVHVYQSKFSVARKLTSRYQKFQMNFDFEISRLEHIVLLFQPSG